MNRITPESSGHIKMASMDDINRKLAALFRVQGISNPACDLEALVRDNRLDEADALLDGKFDAIRELLKSESGLGGNESYRQLDGRLTGEEYVLPPELNDVHPVVLANITSGKTIDHFTHGGLLLFDDNVGGTGKTEYAMFLAAQAGDKARFVRVNGNSIRESGRPGTALKTLYQELEARAVREGFMYVALLDEFEKLVNKYAKQHTAVREEQSDSREGDSIHAQRRRETRETLEVDAVGEELFSTLKDCVSGGEQIRHVFTIAASNQSVYPETLLRRLQPVELFTFGINEVSQKHDAYPAYGHYDSSIPRILALFQATHVRLNDGKKSEAIERIAGEMQLILEGVKEGYRRQTEEPYREVDVVFANVNNAYLEGLLGYFGCGLEEEQAWLREERDRLLNERARVPLGVYSLTFAGQMRVELRDEDERYISRHRISQYNQAGGKETPEISVMLGLTPDKVAKWFKANQDAFRGYDSAKQFIGELLFPQLRTLREYKAGRAKQGAE